MRNNMPEKAEQCYKIILGMTDKHVPTLLAYGIYCCLRERFEEAHVFLRSAVDLQKEESLPMTLLGFYYAYVDEILESEHVLESAQKLAKAGENIRRTAADFLVTIQADPFAERIISQVSDSRVHYHAVSHAVGCLGDFCCRRCGLAALSRFGQDVLAATGL